MAYLAIARKWRPQRFEDVVGQGHITRTLQNAITLQRVHHAFLFTGARGVGKTTAARILAKTLNCEQPVGAAPCNECRSCREITAGVALDVHEIDAASNTGVDSIREIRDNLRYLPQAGRHKIYIVDEVHMLSNQAFNALLKTLEEPPAHVIFIFATTDPQKVPETILSRCQRFDFKRISLKQIVEKLAEIARTEEVAISEAALLMLAREAEGSMRDAQSLLDQVISSAATEVTDEQVVEILGLIDRRLLFFCLEGILGRNAEACLEIVERVFEFGYDTKQFAKELTQLIRHLNAIKVAENAGRFVDVAAEEFEQLKKMATRVGRDELTRHFTLAMEGLDLIARSENPRTALEMVLLRLCQVRPMQPLDELIRRTAELEQQLKQGVRIVAPPGRTPESEKLEPPPTPASPSPSISRATSTAAPAPTTPNRFSQPTDGGPGVGRRDTSSVRSDSRSQEGRAVPRAGVPVVGTSEEASDPDEEDGPEQAPWVDPSVDLADAQVVVNEASATLSGAGSHAVPDRWYDFLANWEGQSQIRVRPHSARAMPFIADDGQRIVLAAANSMSQNQFKNEIESPEVQGLLQRILGRETRLETVLVTTAVDTKPCYSDYLRKKDQSRREEISAKVRAQIKIVQATRVFNVPISDIQVKFLNP